MREKIIVCMFWALVLHMIVSVTFIIDPPFFKGTRLSKVYKTHLLPGPFFTDSRIVNNYSLSLSWKINGRWSPAISPAKEAFNQYHASLNPSDLYRSRIVRTLYVRLTLPDSVTLKDREEFLPLKQYMYDYYVPRSADSVRMWIINTQAENFMLTKDSVYVTFSR